VYDLLPEVTAHHVPRAKRVSSCFGADLKYVTVCYVELSDNHVIDIFHHVSLDFFGPSEPVPYNNTRLFSHRTGWFSGIWEILASNFSFVAGFRACGLPEFLQKYHRTSRPSG
jgi:hypothetical protein